MLAEEWSFGMVRWWLRVLDCHKITLRTVTYCSIVIGWRLGWRNTRFRLADVVEGFFRASFWLADEILGFLVLDSDWLPTVFRFRAQAECVRQCIKIESAFIFGTLWLSREKFFELLSGARADIYYGVD